MGRTNPRDPARRRLQIRLDGTVFGDRTIQKICDREACWDRGLRTWRSSGGRITYRSEAAPSKDW